MIRLVITIVVAIIAFVYVTDYLESRGLVCITQPLSMVLGDSKVEGTSLNCTLEERHK